MLKSTHRSADTPAATPLPPGWTEHKAPSGHPYYYNAETKQSTYKRPEAPPEDEPLAIDFNATQPDHVVRGSIQALDEFNRNQAQHSDAHQESGHFTGGKSYQDRTRRNHGGDRPKSKKSIPNAEPWLLVMTKFGRRFVHNTETMQSLWKFPQDVMMAVVDMDNAEWKVEQKAKEEKAQAQAANVGQASTHLTTDGDQVPEDYDSEEYEEVEVTDDEEDPASKRMRMDHADAVTGDQPHSAPQEMGEDDIAWQLAQLEDEGGHVPYTADHDFETYLEGEEAEEGLPFTDEDSIALFRSLLDDSGISPFSTFEKLIEDGSSAVEDDRWVSLNSMARRQEVFAQWSRDRIAEQQAMKAAQPARTKDPRIKYLEFLEGFATPKLYWPEFKRKYRKEPEMKDVQVSDKEREKLYREIIPKLKLTESDRRKELVSLLKSVPTGEGQGQWNKHTPLDNLPEMLLKDIRFYIISKEKKVELVSGFLDTLPE